MKGLLLYTARAKLFGGVNVFRLCVEGIFFAVRTENYSVHVYNGRVVPNVSEAEYRCEKSGLELSTGERSLQVSRPKEAAKKAFTRAEYDRPVRK